MKISESHYQKTRPEFSEVSDVICAKSRSHPSHNQLEAFSLALISATSAICLLFQRSLVECSLNPSLGLLRIA